MESDACVTSEYGMNVAVRSSSVWRGSAMLQIKMQLHFCGLLDHQLAPPVCLGSFKLRPMVLVVTTRPRQ